MNRPLSISDEGLGQVINESLQLLDFSFLCGTMVALVIKLHIIESFNFFARICDHYEKQKQGGVELCSARLI